MVWLNEDGECISPWRTSHRPFASETLEEIRKATLDNSFTLNVRPSDTCGYNQEGFDKLVPRLDIYYIPTFPNEVGLDSFIWHKDHLYVFRFTVDKRHGIKDGLIPRLEQCVQLPPRSKWRFIFVIADDVDILECSYLQTPGLQELRLFSSIVGLEEYKSKIIEGLGDEEPVAKRLRSAKELAQQSSTRTKGKKSRECERCTRRGARESGRSAGKGNKKERSRIRQLG
jgi:hypothetical protein